MIEFVHGRKEQEPTPSRSPRNRASRTKKPKRSRPPPISRVVGISTRISARRMAADLARLDRALWARIKAKQPGALEELPRRAFPGRSPLREAAREFALTGTRSWSPRQLGRGPQRPDRAAEAGTGWRRQSTEEAAGRRSSVHGLHGIDEPQFPHAPVTRWAG